ncbi:hypothetical protein PTSG_09343 [Salpingoeca rosetta]|uniref:SREBP regulating gene protein n=1 Tax=Salpingoeca rosetta (strain ATCC 50818 / BSB-021) TaxID=946362 RepID=F2UMD0_SALR5|nr:uncharacterized protein PTSG_09343 [Salpingoeca rosetta]EGD78279.1 hypothetical protein PTSG_09343 [Salpingoeca rosetta]|eukprot:XP_004989602.1 hypothetical protein PTSG_09343 [Salpingoeca rosetta]
MRFRAVRLLATWLRRRSIRVALIMSLCITFLFWAMLPSIEGTAPWAGITGAAAPQQEHERHPPPVAWYHRRHLAAASNDSCKYTTFDGLQLVDDLGRVCNVEDAQPNGCCFSTSQIVEAVCDSCDAGHCCRVYEHCVSCCLAPKHVPLRRFVFHNLTEPQRRVLSLVSDQFEYCEAKCRTSSQSVQHENNGGLHKGTA